MKKQNRDYMIDVERQGRESVVLGPTCERLEPSLIRQREAGERTTEERGTQSA